jgi:hypothetical protein
MLMVILGAGASYDSNPYSPARGASQEHPHRMPLAKELFSDRPLFEQVLAQFPECDPIVADLLPRTPDFSIERELQRLSDEAEQDPKRHQQLAAVRYYLHAMIHECETQWLRVARGRTNQVALMDRLRRKQAGGICLVTFNYDTMIEHALRSVDVEIDGLPSYVSNDSYKLIKLHGSANWAHIIPTGLDLIPEQGQDQVRKWIIRNINSLTVDYSQFRIIESYPMAFRDEEQTTMYRGGLYEKRQSRIGLFPAIAIPVEKKIAFECPAEHIHVLESCLPQVDRLIVVGWRATEIPFLKLLADEIGTRAPQPKCIVVAESPESTRITVAHLQRAGVKAEYSHFVAGFTDFITSPEAAQFLAD